jgi:hypothetical protein
MWARFFRKLVGVSVGLLAFVYVAVVMIDPYDTLPFSPDFERTAVSTNQRFSYPALAIDADFDSAVFGTSTARLLRPIDLNKALGGRFVNLSMNSATAYEQGQIFKLFATAHPQPKMIVIGVDVSWCEAGTAPAKFTFRPFPPWLYDGNPWNDALYLMNFSAIEQAGRQLATMAGLRAEKYGHDGYADFLPPVSEYDLHKVRVDLYAGGPPRPRAAATMPEDSHSAYRQGLEFPAHGELDLMMTRLPSETVKVFLFVPYHHFTQPAPGSLDDARWAECKQRFVARAGRLSNAHVLDFMYLSQITGIDQNYWDPLHFSVEIAASMPDLIAAGVRTQRGQEGLFRYLSPPAQLAPTAP